MKKILFLLLFLSDLHAVINQLTTFSEWRDICLKLPEYDHRIQEDEAWPPSVIPADELQRVLAVNLKHYNDIHAEPDNWVKKMISSRYAQNVVLDAGENIFIQGDIHGSIHSLMRNLNKLKEKGFLRDDFTLNNMNLFFLGDYADRGRYGVEAIYTLMRLKEQNPQAVFLLKGNHEDIMFMHIYYSLNKELGAKYKKGPDIFFDILSLYGHLPEVMFVGAGSSTETNYLLLCHGVPMIGYNPHALLRKNNHQPGFFYEALNADPAVFNEQISQMGLDSASSLYEEFLRKSGDRGFLNKILPNGAADIAWLHDDVLSEFRWGDLDLDIAYRSNRGSLAFPPNVIAETLNIYSDSADKNYVRALFRGHQHGESGNGCFNQYEIAYDVDGAYLEFVHCGEDRDSTSLNDGDIYTLISAPEGAGDASGRYDSFAIIETAPLFKDWKITPYEFNLTGDEYKLPSLKELGIGPTHGEEEFGGDYDSD